MNVNLRLYGTIAVIGVLMFFFSRCINDPARKDPRHNGYAGSETCTACHGSVTDSFFHTAHFNSTSLAGDSSVAGNFSPGSNLYQYTPSVKVFMEKEDNRFYQAAYNNGKLAQKQSFDIVVGSGRKAQTYLYWLNDKIFQLPVSWYVPAAKWANSPNFPAHQARFDRNIPIGCFECHSSYIKRDSIEDQNGFRVDHFDRNTLITGIDCERCHGPALEHADFHKQNPAVQTAKYLVPYRDLGRQQQLDMCSVCHSGIRDHKRTTFFFRPGTDLVSFVPPDTSGVDTAKLDVHGNQYQLLSASKCFAGSQMTCTSCHSPHNDQRSDMQAWSVKCMSCHEPESKNYCKLEPRYGKQLQVNCVDCHMPEKTSRLVLLQSQGDSAATANKVRTHFISVYQRESDNFIKAHGLK